MSMKWGNSTKRFYSRLILRKRLWSIEARWRKVGFESSLSVKLIRSDWVWMGSFKEDAVWISSDEALWLWWM